MKRYVLSFLAAYAAALAVTAGLMAVSLANWFFGPSPLWFDLLSAILVLLTFLAAGELAGRRAKRKDASTPKRGLFLLTDTMVILALLGNLELEPLHLLSAPGMVTGNALVVLLDLKYRWGYQTHLHWVWPLTSMLSAAVQAILFHLGWKWGQTD